MSRALTALEKLIVAIGFVVILGGLYAIYLMGSRYLRMTQTQSQLERQAALGLQQICQDLCLAVDDPRALYTQPPNRLCFLSPQALDSAARSVQAAAYDDSGHMIFRKWIAFFGENGQLVRAELNVKTPQARPFSALAAPAWESLQASLQRKRVADSFNSFNVEQAARGVYLVEVVFSLPQGEGPMCRLDTDVFLLNGSVP